jgi:hypothetical protein
MSEATWPTEAERKARLCKRAGCNCEEDVMTDPTPEEIAYEWGIRNGWDLKTEADLAETIRVAVAAENEACAEIVLAGTCDGGCFHGSCASAHERAAAIRARSATPDPIVSDSETKAGEVTPHQSRMNEARGEAAIQKRIERATQPLLDKIDRLTETLKAANAALELTARHP